jgi:hypothetical protein
MRPVLVAFWSNEKPCNELLQDFEKANARGKLADFVCARLYVDHIPVGADGLSSKENERQSEVNLIRLKELSGDDKTPFFVLFNADGKLVAKVTNPGSLDDLTILLNDLKANLGEVKANPRAENATPKCTDSLPARLLFNPFLGLFW